MTIFRVLWLSLKDVFDELFTLIGINLIWTVISAPLMLIAFFLISMNATVLGVVAALLAVLCVAPSNAGLYVVAQRVSEGRVIGWRLFFEGFRQYLRLSWQVYGLWALGLILIGSNLVFYRDIASTFSTLVRILLIYLLIVWFGLLIYIGPLMVLQTDKRLRVIARNAFLMVFGRPIFTLVTLLLMALIGGVLGWFVPLLPLLLTFSLLALWSFRATSALIAEAEARRAALEERSAAAAANPAATEKGRGGQVRPRD
jgi:uncharacterized membrane protein YesL